MFLKKSEYDYLCVGAGWSSAVFARIAAEQGKKVLIIDRRLHIGGNCYDYYHNGVLTHKYGPHYFRTDFQEVWDWVSKFTKWRDYQFTVKAFVNGQLMDMPINLNTFNKMYGTNWSSKDLQKFLKKYQKDFLKNKPKNWTPGNSEEQVLSKVPKEIYEGFFKGYTIKQWDIDPKDLDASVTARIPIRTNKDERYFGSKYQAMPLEGYTKVFEKIFDHKNIKIQLGVDFKEIDKKIYKNLIYTGCIDEFFNYKFGKLPYRSLRFEFEEFNEEYKQPYSQINYPNEYDYTRKVEVKHCTGQKCLNTVVVKEYSQSGEKGEPYYPIPRPQNKELYQKYEEESKKHPNIFFIGRLAKYKYINMDQTIKQALDFTKEHFNLS